MITNTGESYRRGEVLFSTFKEEVLEYADHCFDAEVELENIEITPQGLSYQVEEQGASSFFGEEVRSAIHTRWTRHALGQFVERIDAPRMGWIADDRHCDEILRRNVLETVQRERENMHFRMRTFDDLLRAVLSMDYSIFNHTKFIDLIGQALDAAGWKVRVWNGTVGDEMRAYLLNRSIKFMDDPTSPNGGSALHPAVYISNSEIGTGKVRIAGGLFRKACSNGMILGWNEENSLQLVHRHLSERTMVSAVADALVAAFKMSEEGASKFINSQNILLEPDRLEGLQEKWAKKFGITVESKEEWVSMVKAEAASNGRPRVPALVDVLNSATYMAQSRKVGKEREAIERMAGELMYAELPERFLR
jgi:hypothetical protein